MNDIDKNILILFKTTMIICYFIIIYVVGIFTTFNFNPLNWIIINNEYGRFVFIIVTLFYIIKVFIYKPKTN